MIVPNPFPWIAGFANLTGKNKCRKRMLFPSQSLLAPAGCILDEVFDDLCGGLNLD